MTARTKKAAVLGWPVDHSLSPRLHAYWLKHYGIDGTYERIAVPPDSLEKTLTRLRDEDYAGCNLTLPHKEAALDLMDGLSPMAARIGAVNTVVIEDGVFKGDNTDWFGFIENVRQTSPLWHNERPGVVIGAGGAARAVIVALIEAGLPQIHILNRTVERAEALALDLAAEGCVLFAHALTDTAPLKEAGILVNTSSLGMAGNPPLDLRLDALPADAVVSDIVYTPLQTGLLKQAGARGNPVVDGLGMLLHQGRPGFHAWFGVMPDVTDGLRRHMTAALA